MPIAYLVPVDRFGFSTDVQNAARRDLWCRNCATPCDKTLRVPADNIPLTDCQVGPGYDTCVTCGKVV